MLPEDPRRRLTPRNIFILKTVLSMLPVPAVALAAGVVPMGCVVALIAGLAVSALIRTGNVFSVKVFFIAAACQALVILVLGNIFGGMPVVGIASLTSGWSSQGKELALYNSAGSSDAARPMKTMSVILPCANEGVFAVNTARSIGKLTPKGVLLEIIVVDDGSTPPLEQFFKENSPEVLEQYPIRFVRHETFTGLINAKKQGGDRAKGDVLTFLDCHVLPRDYGESKFWSDGIMSRISENYRRVVVPSITDLDADKWEEIGRPNGVAKCYLSWDVDFRWFDSDDDYVPIMSGGLLAMSRDWWFETGGYDTGMIGWGGENIDQSLRIWLCGGEIVQATDSHVAHMWRVNSKPQTKAKYTVPEGAVNSNRYRVALAWMDDYLDKANDFSVFSRFVGKKPKSPLPDISSILEVKNRMSCKPFQWFVDKFSSVYFKSGVLPEKIFRIRDENSNLCLARRSTDNRQEHRIVAAPCSLDDNMQLWHKGNRDGGECCSGLRNYDSMYCLAGGQGGRVHGHECNTYGRVHDQHVIIRDDGEIFFNKMDTCVSVAANKDIVVHQAECDEEGVLKEFVLKTLQNGKTQIVESTTNECLTAFSPVENESGSVELATCSEHIVAQQFTLKESSLIPGAVEIVTWENLCLDAGDGQHVFAYSCYEAATVEEVNKKQFYKYDAEKRTLKNMFHPTCLSVKDGRIDFAASQLPVRIAGCVEWDGVAKPEQKFARIPSPVHKGAVLLKSGTFCLGSDKDTVVVVHCPSKDSDADSSILWFLEGADRVRNMKADKCIDGNDQKTPILYACYDSSNDNQEWIDPRDNLFLKNARAKMCLDYHPPVERDVAVSKNCKTGAKWKKYGEQESKEMRIYKATKAKVKAPVIG